MTKARSALRKLATIYQPTLHVAKVHRHNTRLQVINLLYGAVPSFFTSSCTGNCCVWFYPTMSFWSRIKTKQNQNAQQKKGFSLSPKIHTSRKWSALTFGSSAHLLTSQAALLFNTCHSQVWNSREARVNTLHSASPSPLLITAHPFAAALPLPAKHFLTTVHLPQKRFAPFTRPYYVPAWN